MLDLHDRFAPFFPLRGLVAELAVVEYSGPPSEAGDTRLVLRLIIWDEAEQDGTRSVRDIKEQEIYMGDAALYDDPVRVDEMLYAMQDVFAEVLSKPIEILGTLMPNDLMPNDLLKLKKARSREDFIKAMRVRSRLGAFLER